MFHRRLSTLKYLAGTISISCAFVQRPATNDSYINISDGVYTNFKIGVSGHSRSTGEGAVGGGR